MRASTCALALLALLVAVAQGAPTSSSVSCVAGNPPTCSLHLNGTASDWTARAYYDLPALNSTGWAELSIEARADVADSLAAYAVGYIDGAVTVDLIDQAWQSLRVTPKQELLDWLQSNNEWVTSMIQHHAGTDQLWYQVSLIYAQFNGLVDGYNMNRGGLNPLTPNQILFLAIYDPELTDVESALFPEKRPDLSRMTPEEYAAYVRSSTHCSGLVRVNADLTEMWTAHATWASYFNMLRIFRAFKLPYVPFNSSSSSSSDDDVYQEIFSGYPGPAVSTDDFYITSHKLAVLETTNDIYNNSLYDLITPESLLYWVRVTLANRLGSSSPLWHETFYKYVFRR